MPSFKVQTGLRVHEDIHEKLKFISSKDGRSINNFIEFIIKQYIDEYEAENGSIPVTNLD